MNITVGTRGSHLALSQTLLIVHQLKEYHKQLNVDVKVIKTKGDLNQSTPLHKMNDKGIFVKEIESELLNGNIDLAIHSMKDMPSEMDEGLDFPVITQREDPRDCMIVKKNLIHSNPENISPIDIGTGSKRRAFQLKSIFPKSKILPIRGNIDTRIRKLQEEKYDAIILAVSGLKRVQREEEIHRYFSLEEILPAPCQGMLALQTRKHDKNIIELLQVMQDEIATIQYQAERAFLKEIQGGCHLPVGAYCKVDGNKIKLWGMYGDENGDTLVRDSIEGLVDNAKVLGKQLAIKLKASLEEHHG